jgi:hypothetical protein
LPTSRDQAGQPSQKSDVDERKVAAALEELMAAAKSGHRVTYGRLMRITRLSRGRPLMKLVGVIDCREQDRGAPGFASLIVRKDTGYPGGGYFCDGGLPRGLVRPKSRAADPRLSSAERAYVSGEQRRAWLYYSA